MVEQNGGYDKAGNLKCHAGARLGCQQEPNPGVPGYLCQGPWSLEAEAGLDHNLGCVPAKGKSLSYRVDGHRRG